MIGLDLEGRPVPSDDGGATWSAPDGPVLQSVVWDGGPVGLASDGTVVARTSSGTWERLDRLPGAVALDVASGTLHAYAPPASLWHSEDGGRTWTDRDG